MRSVRQFPPWLLGSRLDPPAVASVTIERPRLLGETVSRARRTIVVAPPGFGKTDLLVGEFRRSGDGEARAAWFAADPLDDPGTILAYIAAALGIDPEPLLAMADHYPARALQGLLATIDTRRTPHSLILDDVDRWTPDVREVVLIPLFRLAPENLAILCSLRSTDEQLAAHTDLSLGPTDLQFDLDDVKRLCGRSISMRRARSLLRQSQGWPKLVGVLTEQYRRSITPAMADTVIGEFAHKHLAPLLAPEDRMLLAKLGALREFDASLARRLGSGPSFERLMDLKLIAAVPARDGLALAVNPLLTRLAPDLTADEIMVVRKTAFFNLFEREKFVAAMRLAVEIDDDACITAIIDACDPMEMFLGRGIAPLERITELIPEEVLERDSRLACGCVISLLKNGRIREASVLVEKMAETMPALEITEAAEENAHFFVARALLNIHQGRMLSPDELRLMSGLAERWAERRPEARSWIAAVKTHAAQIAGRIAEARAAALEGIRHCSDFDGRYATFYHHFDLAVIEAIAGRRSLARETFARIMRDYRDVMAADMRLRVILDAFLIELDHEEHPRNFDAMGRLRTICRELPFLEGWPDVFAAAFRTYAEKLVLAGDADGAIALLDAGRGYAEREGIAPLVFILDHQRAIVHMITGDSRAARSAVASYASLDDASILHRSWREVEICLEARAMLDRVMPDRRLPLLLAAAMSHAVFHDLGRCKQRYAALAAPANHGLRAEMAAAICREDPGPADISGHLLTQRGREVMTALATGMTDKEIGLLLGISPHGVRYHLKRVYAQMNVETRAEACRKLNLLSPTNQRSPPY